MSGAGLLRLPEARYDAELLALYGLSDALPLLPPLLQPTDVVGHVTPDAAAATGLRAGTPVVAGYFDVVASALGSGAVGAGAASIVLGSWSINQVFADAPGRDPRVFMVAAFGPGRFANMDNSATSAANLEWYVRTLIERGGHHGDPFAQVNDLVGQACHRRRTTRCSIPSSTAAGTARISAAASMAWPAGTTRATCCARCTKAWRSSIAAMSRC